MKNLLKPLFIIAVVLSMGILRANAQENVFTQYYLNMPGVNAGFTGLEDYLDLKVGVREGWNNFGVKDNNVYLSAYGALGSSSRSGRRSNSLRVSDPGKFDRIKTEKEFRRKHAIGGMVYNRRVGPYQSFVTNANYAYHLPISKKMNLSLGAKMGYGSQRIDFSGLTVRDDINDLFYQQLILAQQGNQQSLVVDFGTAIYSKHFFMGLSTQNMVVSKLSGDQILDGNNKKSYMLHSMGTFSLSANLTMASGFNVMYSQNYDLAWAVNARVRYKDVIYFGTAYDSNSKISGLLGMTTEKFDLNYSYDRYLSDLNSFNVSVHEVVVGLPLFNKVGLRPRFW
jgi:type IX secretion system PorP/SprF family membrane protein